MTAALSYAVHTSPAPLRAGQDATVRITVTNPGPDPVTCEGITVTVPTGPGIDALTSVPEAITARTDDAGWLPEHRGGGVFAVRSTAPGAQLKPGAQFEVTLDGIEVGRTIGTATLGISEVTGSGTLRREHATGGRLLAKAPADALLEDFVPDRVSVQNGECVTLTWKCSPGPDYDLYYGTEPPVRVNDFIVDGSGSWPSPPLHTATAFMLLASTKDAGGSPVTYGLTTAVIVREPDLVVGSLDANGSVRLFGAVQEIAGGTQSKTSTYFADTDGVITGYIKTAETGNPAYLTVTVTPKDARQSPQQFATQSWDPRGGDQNQEASLLVPVPRNSTVKVVQKGDGDFDASVTWFPFGTGPLREYQP
ncbi:MULTISPECIES: hypothetical protein [unclassified Streptomyces]|uniref:hypothetical protein n=1 Tax=unclassified Streptomyces TaxID=2593676 RepID=UPI00380E60B6